MILILAGFALLFALGALGIQHKFKTVWSRVGESITTEVIIEADGEDNRDPVITAGAADFTVLCAFTVAALKSIMITSDVAVVLKTNSVGSPGDTINIPAGVFEWNNLNGITCPFTATATAFHFVNQTADPPADSNMAIRILKDATP